MGTAVLSFSYSSRRARSACKRASFAARSLPKGTVHTHGRLCSPRTNSKTPSIDRSRRSALSNPSTHTPLHPFHPLSTQSTAFELLYRPRHLSSFESPHALLHCVSHETLRVRIELEQYAQSLQTSSTHTHSTHPWSPLRARTTFSSRRSNQTTSRSCSEPIGGPRMPTKFALAALRRFSTAGEPHSATKPMATYTIPERRWCWARNR